MVCHVMSCHSTMKGSWLKGKKRLPSAMRLFMVLSGTPYYIRYAVKSSLCLSCWSVKCSSAIPRRGSHISTRKKVSKLLMRRATRPSILRSRPRDCSLGQQSSTSKSRNACGRAYRKKIIMTPNIFASSHLFEDTLPQYFRSSR